MNCMVFVRFVWLQLCYHGYISAIDFPQFSVVPFFDSVMGIVSVGLTVCLL